MTRVSVTLPPDAGYDDDRPVSFSLGDRLFRTRAIIDVWHGSDHTYVKLAADDGNIYVLRHDRETDAWELVMMEAVRQGQSTTAKDDNGQ
jgi:hypothetical protein